MSEIRGRGRVEEVELADLDSGRRRSVACDTVVFSADWVPDHELAVLGGVELDELTRGPAVDPGLHTSRPGVFGAGNVLHGAEQADVAALSGRRVASSVTRYLATGEWPAQRVAVCCEPPLGWIAPNAISRARRAAHEPARGAFRVAGTRAPAGTPDRDRPDEPTAVERAPCARDAGAFGSAVRTSGPPPSTRRAAQ